MVKYIKLADNLSIPAEDYANQGNSFIGIRGSGKTYTGTKAAEQLLLAGIPIIAFDPSGVWKSLRHGIDGKPGFPVVVAGGDDPDVELTEKNAVDIVAIALEQGVSLIIDLQGPNTASKAAWQRIMANCIVYLMENNKQYGLRHVFIEEAAEFVPQRVYPGGQFLYSQIERMARMGRNFALGFTLINQRAEEIAKAVFEICEMVVIHRQTGKNSLKAIKSWLDLRAQSDTGMLDTLPTLKDGEAWVVDFNRIILVKILPKQTFHPNPKSNNVKVADRTPVDVTAFIDRFKTEPPIINHKDSLEVLRAENAEMRKALASAKVGDIKYKEILQKIGSAAGKAAEALEEITKLSFFNGVDTRPLQIAMDVANPQSVIVKDSKSNRVISIKNDTPITAAPNSGFRRILIAAAMRYPNVVSKLRIGLLSGLSSKSGTFSTYIASLKKDGLITVEPGGIKATELAVEQLGTYEPLATNPDTIVQYWKGFIGAGSGAARILQHLADHHPEQESKSNLGHAIGMSHTSGSFNTYLSKLKSLGLIKAEGQMLRAADELFN
ncbi:hypothetical protein [Mucilaginibacter sp.]|uniref:hypothetical protein n=1 Tax=Mucilaginibacter sp. TaxID=1882438 RepID=UPI0035BBF3A1